MNSRQNYIGLVLHCHLNNNLIDKLLHGTTRIASGIGKRRWVPTLRTLLIRRGTNKLMMHLLHLLRQRGSLIGRHRLDIITPIVNETRLVLPALHPAIVVCHRWIAAVGHGGAKLTMVAIVSGHGSVWRVVGRRLGAIARAWNVRFDGGYWWRVLLRDGYLLFEKKFNY